MILMSEMPAGDTHDVIHHGGQVVAVVVPIGEYQQRSARIQQVLQRGEHGQPDIFRVLT
jgi:hypothetical protein